MAVTGHVEEEFVLKAMNSGMDRVFPKPFPMRDFGKLIMNMNFIKEMPEQFRVETDNEDEIQFNR